jgi:hypothetical protein
MRRKSATPSESAEVLLDTRDTKRLLSRARVTGCVVILAVRTLDRGKMWLLTFGSHRSILSKF